MIIKAKSSVSDTVTMVTYGLLANPNPACAIKWPLSGVKRTSLVSSHCLKGDFLNFMWHYCIRGQIQYIDM